MNPLTLLALLAVLPTLPGLAAETIDAGDFSVDVTPELAVRYKGETLISGDRCVSFRGLKPGEPALADAPQGRLIRQDNVLTVLAEKGRNTLRREVAVSPGAVEISFEIRVFGPTGGSHLQYDLLTPKEYLEGLDYDVWTGAPRGPLKKDSSTFSIADTKPSEYLLRTARYIILKRPGAECSLDFNPDGAWVGESNYGDNFSTTPYHDGERLHWLMLCSGGRNGGIFRGKVIIRPGAQPYESVHSTADVAYTSNFPVALALNFSDGAADGDYEVVGAEAAEGKPYRWRDPEQVRIVARETGGLLYRDFATAAGNGEGILDIELPSGLYLLTLNLRDDREDTGPFSVIGPEGALLENVTVPRADYWFKTAPLRIRNGAASLHLTGDWKLGALTLQPILLDAEDFLFDRGFWNAEVGEG